ncbi:procollagen galactosyltransferase 2 isoform X1 [Hydra vulgaris]|uniref:procollagen galactosyltransferase 2 isoform X1 n=1 Tax=Hydra vulgaris TaxID=6087 RepID=UPI000640F109|nr:procollagen galactosyltransferase 2 [Hydra vulgaris]
MRFINVYLFIVAMLLIHQAACESVKFSLKKPTILLSIISRNEEHILPTFLAYIEQLNYPKNRITILIQTDHNEDRTFNVLSEWSRNVKSLYHDIYILHEAFPITYNDSLTANQWTTSRFLNLLKLRQNALDKARRVWSDYILFVDTDNFLMNKETLNILIATQQVIVSPMLRSFDADGLYSNFWGAMDERGYYKRVPEYFTLLKRETLGVYYVPMVHSTMLIDMRSNLTDTLMFYPIPLSYSGVIDDILVFAQSAKHSGINLAICNTEVFGFLLNPCAEDWTLEDKKDFFNDVFLNYATYNEPLERSVNVPHSFPVPSYGIFDEIFVINLIRRQDRFKKMSFLLKELGFKFRHFEAVDGRELSAKKVKEMGIFPLEGFKDPYLERPMTLGEIGCFLSHWRIWNEIVDRSLDMVLVLEDDVRFESGFNKKLHQLLVSADEIQKNQPWDFMYLGRKRMSSQMEYYVEGSDKIVWAKYSYWTLGYIIRLSGAKKLIAGDPLSKMLPVDEYIPIMFDNHPETEFKLKFNNRNLIAFSAEPLLMHPTHYVGEMGYVSDTEDTLSIKEEDVKHFREKKKFILQSNIQQDQTRGEL